MQSQTDRANALFWNDLCGSTFAKSLGIKDHTLPSLKRFDQEYFLLYPYLLNHVRVEEMRGKKVLEIGLGFGTLGLKIAESGAHYHGLDIAQGPVSMMKHRLNMFNLTGQVFQGSMLECPMPNNSMDYIVSIGCFHHTGNLQKCIDETYRVLKPGGKAFIMVYNQYSYRQWVRWPLKTLQCLLKEYRFSKNIKNIEEEQRAAYDTNIAGKAAPETVFTSITELKTMFAKFSSITLSKENCDSLSLIPRIYTIPRHYLLNNLGRAFGTDIYLSAIK